MSTGPGVGVIGLGFMGRTHVVAYRDAAAAGHANRLVAVCDRDVGRFHGAPGERGNLEHAGAGEALFDPAEVQTHEDPARLLGDDAVELVSICTPTDSHVELAVAALEAGKHVLLEKPVALSSLEAERLATVARRSERACMPAMCMRFWPGWTWLRERVRSGELGGVRSAVFRRVSSTPAWSPDFYRDSTRNGGALFDLHVHDADFVRWCFGEPETVASAGTIDHLTTLYGFADGPEHVVAEGGWDLAPGFGFTMRYTVVFEEATADFVLEREEPLLLHAGGETTPVALAATTGYDGEIRHFLDHLASPGSELAATPDEAVELIRMLEAERRSLETGAPVAL